MLLYIQLQQVAVTWCGDKLRLGLGLGVHGVGARVWALAWACSLSVSVALAASCTLRPLPYCREDISSWLYYFVPGNFH